MVLVSHDRHLVQNVCDTLWRVADGSCAPFDGDLDDYANWLRDERRKAQRGESAARKTAAAAAASAAVAPTTPTPVDAPKPVNKADSKANREALRALDKQIAKLTAELSKLDQALADPAIYEAAKRAEAQKLQQRQAAARAELAAAEEQWLELSEG